MTSQKRHHPTSKGRVLFVSYCFPPVGGVAVQRVSKFVKYLPQFGWECSVLTVQDPSEALMDESLVGDVPPSTVIRRAKTLEPSQSVKAAIGDSSEPAAGLWKRLQAAAKSSVRAVAKTLLQPDAQVLWMPHAVRKGKQLLRELPHDAIIATGPPFTSLLVGAMLARRSGLPLLLDYRDEWGISNAYWENRQFGRFSTALQMRMQRWAVRRAARLIATTPSSAEALTQLAREAGSSIEGTCIFNGFDADDFPPEDSGPQREDFGHGTHRCRLTLVGSLWNLVPVQPFVEGAIRFAAENPELAGELELVFVGNRTQPQETAIDRLEGLPLKVSRLPFVPHQRALALMREADALLLILGDMPHTHRVVNARTFEYMGARRPMLVVSPRGDLWDLTAGLPGTELCLPGEPDRIAAGLAAIVQRHVSGVRFECSQWNIASFERRVLAGQLAQLLDAARVGEAAVEDELPSGSMETREAFTVSNAT